MARAQGLQCRVLLDVGDHDGPRGLGVRRPGRVALDGRPVVRGEPAPGLEAHHTGAVAEQDGRPRRPQGTLEREERLFIDVVGLQGPAQDVGQVIEQPQLLDVLLSGRLLALALGHVDHEPAEPGHHAVVAPRDADDVAKPDLAAIGGQGPILQIMVAHLRGVAPGLGDAPLTVQRMDQVHPEIRLGEPALHGIAEDGLGPLADEREPPGERVGFPHDGVHVLDEIAEPALGGFGSGPGGLLPDELALVLLTGVGARELVEDPVEPLLVGRVAEQEIGPLVEHVGVQVRATGHEGMSAHDLLEHARRKSPPVVQAHHGALHRGEEPRVGGGLELHQPVEGHAIGGCPRHLHGHPKSGVAGGQRLLDGGVEKLQQPVGIERVGLLECLPGEELKGCPVHARVRRRRRRRSAQRRPRRSCDRRRHRCSARPAEARGRDTALRPRAVGSGHRTPGRGVRPGSTPLGGGQGRGRRREARRP